MKIKVEFIIRPLRDDDQEFPEVKSFMSEIRDNLSCFDETLSGPAEINIIRIEEIED